MDEQQPAKPGLAFFEKYLTVWVVLCIGLGIVLGRPLAVNIPLATIKEARPAPGSKAFAYWGVRFATSLKNVVEIVRHRGLNFVISPSNRDLFLERLAEALKAQSDN